MLDSILRSFVGAATRQIGRDSARVLTNRMFGDRHAMVHRHVGSGYSNQQQQQEPTRKQLTANNVLGPFKTAVKDETNLNYAQNYLNLFYSKIREFNEDGIIDEYELDVIVRCAIELKHRLVNIKDIIEDQRTKGNINQALIGLNEYMEEMQNNIPSNTPQNILNSIDRYNQISEY